MQTEKKPQTKNLAKKGLRWFTPFVIGFDLLGRLFLPKRPHILIACMPKSGSTFLAHALAAHSGLKRVRLTPDWGEREQELCEIRLSRYSHSTYISQHHVRHSAWTQELIRRYNMISVVLVRDLFDIVISIRDHMRKEGPGRAIAAFTPHIMAMSDAELEAAIVELAIPWFINFYMGWRDAPDVLLLRYEEVTAFPEQAIKAVLDKAGVANTSESIKKALEKSVSQYNRMNKGVVGRGMNMDPATRKRIFDKLAFYPEIKDDPYIRDMLQRNKIA